MLQFEPVSQLPFPLVVHVKLMSTSTGVELPQVVTVGLTSPLTGGATIVSVGLPVKVGVL